MKIKLSHQEIGRLLDRAASQLDRSTVDELHAARQRALQRQRAPVSGWVGQNGLLRGQLQLSHRLLSWAIAGIVATLLAINLVYWDRAFDHDRDHSDIDIAILTDDLPVAVYVD
jgi:hypothetical protein